jgi:hypothetical protein
MCRDMSPDTVSPTSSSKEMSATFQSLWFPNVVLEFPHDLRLSHSCSRRDRNDAARSEPIRLFIQFFPWVGYTLDVGAVLVSFPSVLSVDMMPSGWYFFACLTIAHLRSSPFPASNISLASFSGSLPRRLCQQGLDKPPQSHVVLRRPDRSIE